MSLGMRILARLLIYGGLGLIVYSVKNNPTLMYSLMGLFLIIVGLWEAGSSSSRRSEAKKKTKKFSYN